MPTLTPNPSPARWPLLPVVAGQPTTVVLQDGEILDVVPFNDALFGSYSQTNGLRRAARILEAKP